MLSDDVTQKILWEKIDCLMTDSVSKNLRIEFTIAELLHSDYKPYHLLCKSHTCEKFDACNIQTLGEIEAKINLRDQIESREPQLKSFIRAKRSIVADAVIPALLKLVAKESDGKTSSLADEFSLILEEDGLYKTFSIYKERRFARLGYSAGSVYESIPQFKKLLERTNKNNLLVRACRLYLESDFVVAALKALANFTYFVTMPFLNFVEQCDQNEMVQVLPKLHRELSDLKYKNKSLETYRVKWTHVQMNKQELESDLEQLIIKEMCTSAAEGLELQCSKEYWASGDQRLRATQLHKLTEDERKHLPTENLCSERYLARFGSLAAQSASHSNKFFKAKRIRDDLTLMSYECATPLKCNENLFKKLDKREHNWTEKQKALFRNKIKESLENNQRDNFTQATLKKCKEHNGPITSLDDLQNLQAKYNDEELKSILRQEMGKKNGILDSTLIETMTFIQKQV